MRSALAGRMAAAGARLVDKVSYGYNFNTGVKPAGMAEDASRSNMMPFIIAGGTNLRESSTGGGSHSHWYAQYPGLMKTRRYRATVTVGSQSSGTNRGCIVWVGGTDGAGGDGINNAVWFRVRGQSLAPLIGTKTGLVVAGTGVDKASGSNALVTPGDTIGLEISEYDGIYTYIGYKNDDPLPGCIWTDTAGEAGVPGKAWGCGGHGIYSGGYFPSLGVAAMACADI